MCVELCKSLNIRVLYRKSYHKTEKGKVTRLKNVREYSVRVTELRKLLYMHIANIVFLLFLKDKLYTDTYSPAVGFSYLLYFTKLKF